MGHSCSVDIQEIVTGAISGSRVFCAPGQQLPGPTPDIWVDGARWVGTRDELNKIAADVDERATRLGATWKDHDAPTTAYDFIGVRFDHSTTTIRVADKTKLKIPSSFPPSISPRSLEQLLGRLLFAGSIVGLPIARYYWAIKWARRIFNHANATSEWTTEVTPPPSVLNLLSSWCREASNTRTWHKPPGPDETYLFTDATPKGWGAVVVTHKKTVFATGGHFTKEFSSINEAECEAVKLGVESFLSILKTTGVLHVVVDNTSTSFDLISGKSSSAELAASVSSTVDALQALNGVRVSLSYVKSQDNPADLPSRAPLTQAALATVHERARSLASKALPLTWSRVLPRDG
jgi:hypothetical protein